MRDFTRDSIVIHILSMAAPVTISMFVQTAYHLVDLYFVTAIGPAATAGVNAAGNVLFMILALSVILTVGTVALVAHAVGRKDRIAAHVTFNQSLMLSNVCALAVTVLLYAGIHPYMRSVAGDEAAMQSGIDFMLWVAPGFALMLPMAIMSCALRATGIVRTPVIAYTMTVGINVILAPILIAGWGTDMPLGVKGAGLATTAGVTIGAIFLALRFPRLQPYMRVQPRLMWQRFDQWRRILTIGFPSSGEYAVAFLCTAVVYHVIRDAGASTQAGFGIGARTLQVILVPAMAIACAAGPVAGQNFGAGAAERVRETFYKAATIGTVLMVLVSIPVHWRPTLFIRVFAADPAATMVAEQFLQLMAWTLVPQSLIYACSGMFQGLGNTMPALISSCVRLGTFAIPALWLSSQASLRPELVWQLWIASVVLQAVASMWLLQLELARQLPPLERGSVTT